MTRKSVLLLLCICATVVSANAVTVTIYHRPEEAALHFAAKEIRDALREQGDEAVFAPLGKIPASDVAVRILLEVANPEVGRVALKAQGYTISRSDSQIRVVGGDATGAMYGGLDVAETVRLEGSLDAVKAKRAAPFIEQRGLKFNIPLDARTPSYSDAGDAAQNAIPEVWDMAFWEEYLDEMARNRYNMLSLWNPHPFPSIVKVPEFPDVALADVKRADIDWVEFKQEFHNSGKNMVTQEVLDNLKTVKKMTIEEKIAFWRAVIQYAKDRGIDVYIITWNVFTWGATGKYGITVDQDNEKTIAYIRASVRETILTYPLLAGIGCTAGEQMKKRGDEYSKEKWLWRVYGEGVRDAKKVQTKRDIRFIHRHHQTGLDEIMQEFGDKYPGTFDTGFKYARARLYSSPRQPFARDLIEELKKHNMKAWWNLRNDDIFYFRWGDPEYVRAFLVNLPPKSLTAGYHMGSDGYVWTREFTSLNPKTPRELEVRKHWYNFMLWGRLGYDPTLGRDFFQKHLAKKYAPDDPAKLYSAWADASRVIPAVNVFHWRDWDYMWAPEGCMDQNSGFHSVRHFIEMPRCAPMEGSRILSIPAYVDQEIKGGKSTSKTPLDVADELHLFAQSALRGAKAVRSETKDVGEDLDALLADIEAMAHLGNYYASKIQGATSLHFFDKTKEISRKDEAVLRLLDAQGHWKRYAAVAAARYKPQLLARTRVLDWNALLEDVKRDVEIARGAK